MEKLSFIVLLPVGLALASVAHSKLPASASNAIERAIVDAYGNNNRNGCLLFTDYGNYGSADYCVKVKKSDLRTINGTRNLYVLVSGDLDEDMAGRGAGGIGGLFVFKEKSNGWELISSDPYIVNGSWGESQLDDFKLKKIGPSKYGWLGGYEYSQGGCSGAVHVLYAPIGPEVKSIYDFEGESACYRDNDNYEDLASPRITTKKPINGYYPIYQSGNNPKKNTVRMVYSPVKQKYVKY